MKKKLLTMLLAVAMVVASTATGFAEDMINVGTLYITRSDVQTAADTTAATTATADSTVTSSTAANDTAAATTAATTSVAATSTAASTTAASSIKSIKPVLTKVSSVRYDRLKLSWEKVEEATGYKVYRATSKSGKYKLVKTVKGSDSLTYTDTKRTCGKTYYYKIRAYEASGGKTIYSKYSVVKSAYARPSKVKNVTVEYAPTAAVYFKIDWDKVTGASGYQLQVKPASTGKWSTYYHKKSTLDGKWYNVYPTEWNSKKERHDVKYIILGRTAYWSLSDAEESYQIRVRAYRTVNGKKVFGLYSEPVTITPAWSSAEELVDFVHTWVDANYPSYNRSYYESSWIGRKTPDNSNWGTTWTYTAISQYEPKEYVLDKFCEGILKTYFGSWWGLDEETAGILYTRDLGDGRWQVWWLS